MFYDEKVLAPPEVSETELEDFHVSGRVHHSESTITCHRGKKASVSNPEDQSADVEETVKSQFALPDELLAKVLGYLPLQDRFRLETVCRQWKRCMFLEVKYLSLNFSHVLDQVYIIWINFMQEVISSWTGKLPAVLHKFKISNFGLLTFDISIGISDKELIVLLAEMASHATEVVVAYDITYGPANLVTFCDIIGPHVTTILLRGYCGQVLREEIQSFANSLARMKRLKKLGSKWLKLIFTCLISFPTSSLPHFQEIELGLSDECDWKLWEHFKSLYGAQLKKVTFRNGHVLDDRFKVYLPWKHMAPFANLEHLDFKIELNECTLTTLVEDLEAISRSCPLLKLLRLTHEGSSYAQFVVSLIDVQNLFIAIGKMKMLEKLDLELTFRFVDLWYIFSGKNLDLFALLENKCSITHLKANVKLYQISSQNKRIRWGIFGSLNNAMPNLRHLDVCCMASELDHFVGLERLQTIGLYYIHSEKAPEAIQDSLIRILKSTPALRSIKFCHNSAELSEDLIGTIIEVAELRMEKHIDFISKIIVRSKSQKAWDARKHLAPRNLTLILDNDIFSLEMDILDIF